MTHLCSTLNSIRAAATWRAFALFLVALTALQAGISVRLNTGAEGQACEIPVKTTRPDPCQQDPFGDQHDDGVSRAVQSK